MSERLFQLSLSCLKKLVSAGLKISFAESCTGGLIAKSITDHSGASDVFECGVVSYSGRIKAGLLGVSEDTLARFGEVSEQTAREMARGIRKLSGADIGVGVTGIAGPGGATADKQVGLIFVSIASEDYTEVYMLELYQDIYDRRRRREYTACFVFEKIIDLIS